MLITAAATVLSVADLDASLAYFKDVLGFHEDFRFGQYAGIQRENCCIHLSHHTNPNAKAPGSGSVYIFCQDVDALYQEITGKGASVDGPPQDYEYGMRDFIARDPDGNQLAFGSPTADETA